MIEVSMLAIECDYTYTYNNTNVTMSCDYPTSSETSGNKITSPRSQILNSYNTYTHNSDKIPSKSNNLDIMLCSIFIGAALLVSTACPLPCPYWI